jgi:hypothetical protein
MAGLVPAIHAVPPPPALKILRNGAAWMPGTRPGMTVFWKERARNRAPKSREGYFDRILAQARSAFRHAARKDGGWRFAYPPYGAGASWRT